MNSFLKMIDMKGRPKNSLCKIKLTRVMLLVLFIVCVSAFLYISVLQKTQKEYPALDETTRRIPISFGSNRIFCDDGKTNLTVDWDRSTTVYTCLGNTILPDPNQVPEYYCETIPHDFEAEHICMTETIEYSKPIPTYGKHRPVHPVYGEYKYLPVQRWLHSLEHGGIVALYHPCADSFEVYLLKKVVKRCLRRYIISPSNLVDEKRPLVLLSWGCKIAMSFLSEEIVEQFIQRHALHGPEVISFHADFEDQLMEKSQLVSDYDDMYLCPERNE